MNKSFSVSPSHKSRLLSALLLLCTLFESAAAQTINPNEWEPVPGRNNELYISKDKFTKTDIGWDINFLDPSDNHTFTMSIICRSRQQGISKMDGKIVATVEWKDIEENTITGVMYKAICKR